MGKGKNKKNNKNEPQNEVCGEVQKEEKVETTNEGQNGDKNKENSRNKEIVLKAYIHCDGCANKIIYCLKGFNGVEEVKVDSKNNKVIVRGQKADPAKVLERIQRKYSRNVELTYPKLKANGKGKKEPEKKQEPQVKIAVLKMHIHCEGCAHDIKKNIGRMQGVLTVEPDMNKSQVTVTGAFDPPKLVENITKQLRKHVEILKQEPTKDTKKVTKVENMVYCPQNSKEYIYPSQVFSDENVFSCSIM